MALESIRTLLTNMILQNITEQRKRETPEYQHNLWKMGTEKEAWAGQQSQEAVIRTLMGMVQDGLTEQEVAQALQGYTGPMDRIYPLIERFGPARQRQPVPGTDIPLSKPVATQQTEMTIAAQKPIAGRDIVKPADVVAQDVATNQAMGVMSPEEIEQDRARLAYQEELKRKDPATVELNRLRTESLIAGTEAQVASRQEADVKRRILTKKNQLNMLAGGYEGWVNKDNAGNVESYNVEKIRRAALDPRGRGDWWEAGEIIFLDKWVENPSAKGKDLFTDTTRADRYDAWIAELLKDGRRVARDARRAYQLWKESTGEEVPQVGATPGAGTETQDPELQRKISELEQIRDGLAAKVKAGTMTREDALAELKRAYIARGLTFRE